MIAVALAGAAGRMGSRVLSLLARDDRFRLVGALERAGHPALGSDAGIAAGVGEMGVRLTSSLSEAFAEAEGIIDFSSPEATIESARYAARNGKPMVIGTTGLDNDQTRELERLAEAFPCVFAPNMSVGVNVMFEIARRLAELLGDDYDVEIVEMHHRHKVDAPSGTALRLAQVVAEALSRDLNRVGRFERYGAIGHRLAGEIGVQALRGGDVVGEHTLYFLGSGERVELAHRAMSRDNFARGAIRALEWVVGKEPGLYSMRDVLGI